MQLKFRMRSSLYSKIKTCAEHNKIYTSQEIANRLQYTLDNEERFNFYSQRPDIKEKLHSLTRTDISPYTYGDHVIRTPFKIAKCLRPVIEQLINIYPIYPDDKELVRQINIRLAYTFLDPIYDHYEEQIKRSNNHA